jgi:uncharacterized cofD-like protein
MKKIVIFGGGSGLSQLLKGLKLFPVEITAVVTVADNGRSTGRLRKELNIPAVGDISKVLLSMSDADDDVKNVMNYRFTKSNSIGNHSVKNLLLTAALDLNGNFESAIKVIGKLMDIKGTVLPLTDDSIDLVGITDKGKMVVGEERVTKSASKIIELAYNKDFTVNPHIYNAIDEADLIIFSSGSLLTSILPHLIDKKLANYIHHAKAPKMYICNLFTQPGETDNLSVSEHINIINKYLGENGVNIVIANNELIKGDLAKKYLTEEQKDQVHLDYEKLDEMNGR